MRVIESILELKEIIKAIKSKDKTIGFCPTMGFLHDGHISLINASKKKADFTFVSIYVNPSQFNDNNDFINYPRSIKKDISLLENAKADYLWLPNKEEIENIPLDFTIDFEGLDNIMEGFYRPGHFKGVVEIVYRLFDSVNPNFAFFGTKDYQQLQIIKLLVNQNQLPVEIIPCETHREVSGLAMSSRNARLSEDERNNSAFIYQEIKKIAANFNLQDFETLKNDAIQNMLKKDINPEYIEFHEINNSKRIFIAATVGSVRLIDNVEVD
jgi:pantoate--beta-alanine ligase